jgi:acyl carrier protein
MKTVTADDVREFLLNRYREQITARGVNVAQVPDSYDLLTEGIIDSMGLLEMVGALEEHLGFEVDLESLDAGQLTLIGPFSRYVAQRAATISKS